MKKELPFDPCKHIVVDFEKFDCEFSQKDESLLEGSECVLQYNFSCLDGSLKNIYGFEVLNVDNVDADPSSSEIKGLWGANFCINTNNSVIDYLFFMNEENDIYYLSFNLGVDFPVQIANFNEIPTVTKIQENSLDAFVFASPSDNLVLLNQTSATTYPNVPKIMDAIYQYDQLFAITAQNRNSLVFSSEVEVTSWTNSNIEKINFSDNRGRLLKLVNFEDSLFVFREFGITKVSPYSINTDFSISHLFESQSFIFPNTISVCGNKVLFFSEEGLFSFDGNNVDKIDLDFVKKIDLSLSSSMSAKAFNGKYFLACRVNFDDEDEIGCESGAYVNNAMLIFDIDKKQIEIVRGVDILMFATVNSASHSKLCMCFRGSNKNKIGQLSLTGKNFDVNLTQCWKSAFSDFGFDGLKRIDTLQIFVKESCQIVVSCDDMEKTFEISASNSLQKIPINITGERFSLQIKSNQNLQKISNVKAFITVF